jgi:hypothetical protein
MSSHGVAAEPPEPSPPSSSSIPSKRFTARDLARSDVLVLACDGVVFDVTAGADFYGASGPYASLARVDASRALATMNLKLTPDELARGCDGLGADELATLAEWKAKFMSKYRALGTYSRDE